MRCLFDPRPQRGPDVQGTITVNAGDGNDRLMAVVAYGALLDNLLLNGGDGNDRISGAQNPRRRCRTTVASVSGWTAGREPMSCSAARRASSSSVGPTPT